MIEVCDLHCDLLSYLAHDLARTPFDEGLNCSFPCLQEGNVSLQVLAIYTETEKAALASAAHQIHLFTSLLELYPQICKRGGEAKTAPLSILPAIENASGICGEDEPLEKAFLRFQHYSEKVGPFLYISLTWNTDNRFGGGNLSDSNLTIDGKRFLEFLNTTPTKAIDLSHTSSKTAYSIINHIEKKGLELIPIASHSNFHSICPHPRNLSDELVGEIVRRGGVIGLNFFRPFLGEIYPTGLIEHIEHAQKLGALDALCFGADFFYPDNIEKIKYPLPFYLPEMATSACYPHILHELSALLTPSGIEKIAHANLHAFLQKRAALFS